VADRPRLDAATEASSTPDTLRGTPRFCGTRIPVSVVLAWITKSASFDRYDPSV
jgi:uncharacterized protein (DUF433 family)